jgi:hypothetical protein
MRLSEGFMDGFAYLLSARLRLLALGVPMDKEQIARPVF